MATQEQLIQALRNADAAGDTAAAKRIAGMMQQDKPFVPGDSELTAMVQMPPNALKEQGMRDRAAALRAAAEPQTTPLGYVKGVGESALEMVTGLPAILAAGFAGLYELSRATAMGEKDAGKKAADVVAAVQEYGTVSPESTEGKQISEVLAYIPGKIDELTTEMGNAALQAGASPLVATAIKTGGDLVSMLLPTKGIKVVRGKIKKRRILRAEEKAVAKYKAAVDKQAQDMFMERQQFGTPYNRASTKSGVYNFDSPVPTKKDFRKKYIAGLERRPKLSTPEEKAAFRSEVKNAYKSEVGKIQALDDQLYRLEMERIKYGLGEAPKLERPTPIKFKKSDISERAALARDTAGNVAKVIGSVVTILDNIHPNLAQAIRKMEHNIENKMVFRNEVLGDFYELSNSMYKGKRGGNFHQAYLAQDWNEMKALAIDEGVKLKSGGTINDVFADLKGVLNHMGDDAGTVNFKGFKKVPHYLPRHMTVGNYQSLIKKGALPGDKSSSINSIANRHFDDDFMRHDALSNALIGGGRALVSKPVPGAAKRRYLDQIPDSIANRYEPVHTAVQRYVDDMTEGVEIRRFLGEDKANLDLSVQSFVEKVAKDRKLSPQDVRNLKVALGARMTDGRAHAHPIIQAIKNLGYVETIANVWSALTQLGDIFAAMTYLGAGHTLKGAGLAIRGKGILPKNIGYEQIMKEMASPSSSAKVLSESLEYSGFAKLDRFGKRSIVNASASKFKKAMKDPDQREVIRKQYEGLLGDATEQFMKDLAVGNIKNNNVRFAIFNDLADLQPITLSDMPIKYLQHPNLRILYALKTWTAHQLNTLYRRSVLVAKRGKNKHDAIIFSRFGVFIYALCNVGVNTFKDWTAKAIAGEDLTAEDIQDNALNGLMMTFMISKYSVEKNRGDIWGMLADTTKPAVLSVAQRAQRAITKEDPELKDWIGLVPGFGPAVAAVERAKDN